MKDKKIIKSSQKVGGIAHSSSGKSLVQKNKNLADKNNNTSAVAKQKAIQKKNKKTNNTKKVITSEGDEESDDGFNYDYVDDDFDDDNGDGEDFVDIVDEEPIVPAKKKAKTGATTSIKGSTGKAAVEDNKKVKKNKQKQSSTPGTAVISFDDDNDNNGNNNKTKKLSKAEKKAKRLEANKIWQSLHDRRHFDEEGGMTTTDMTETITSTPVIGLDLNPRHTQYYQIQLNEIFSKHSNEWENFVMSMKQELPMTFRISQSIHPHLRQSLINKIEHQYKRLKGRFIQFKGEPIVGDLVKVLSWLPMTYQLAVDNHTLSHDPSLVDLHHFITREVDLGHFVRQEAVSMIPALLLDLHHSHIVLDACAAPGSKTEQVYALMTQSARQDSTCIGFPSMKGFLMANDSDPKRIQTLMNRFQKCFIPNLIFSCMNGESLSTYFTNDGHTVEVFDRIVCDVPCSGDGTFRKCPHLWRLFRPRISIDFHKIQVNILIETLKVLKVGGKVVYSTCSLNPIEDEAVIAAVLRKYRGKVRLAHVDVSKALPGLHYRPGISHWRADADIFVVGEEDKDNERTRQESLQRLPKLVKSLQPPANEQEAKEMELHRCLRILPQDQDTGGFFIALLEKIESIPYEEPVLSSGKKLHPEATAPKPSKSSLQVVEGNKKKSAVNSNGVTGKSLQAMTELGYNPKKAALNELATFSVNPLSSLTQLTEFPTLKIFRHLPWKQHLLYLNDSSSSNAETDCISKPYCFVQRVPTEMVEEEDVEETTTEGQTETETTNEKKNKTRVIQVKDNNRIDPSELVIMSSAAAVAVNSWANSVPILHLGANVTCNSNKVITKGFAFNPYSHNVLQDFIEMGQCTVQATISTKDMAELLKLAMVKIQTVDNNPFAKEIKKTITIDYFEDRDGDKAAFMQHPGLEAASHIALSDAALTNISTTLHQLETNGSDTKDRFFLCLTIDDVNASLVGNAVASATVAAAPSDSGKRRLSKAEKKKLSKEKAPLDNKAITTSSTCSSNIRMGDQQENSSIETSPLTLLFVCSWTADPEETTTDFASHWMLLTPADVYESLQSVL